jgi:predicted thioredoxin/glutaredoxin
MAYYKQENRTMFPEFEDLQDYVLQKRAFLNVKAISEAAGVDCSNFEKALSGKKTLSIDYQEKVLDFMEKTFGK